MEKGSVKDRLKEFVSYLNISEREFCRSIGVGSAYIQSIKKSIPADKMEAISKQYPELNPIWLLRGTGKMLLSEAEPNEDLTLEVVTRLLEDSRSEVSRLLSIIESQQRTIESLSEANKKADALLEKVVRCADVG